MSQTPVNRTLKLPSRFSRTARPNRSVVSMSPRESRHSRAIATKRTNWKRESRGSAWTSCVTVSRHSHHGSAGNGVSVAADPALFLRFGRRDARLPRGPRGGVSPTLPAGRRRFHRLRMTPEFPARFWRQRDDRAEPRYCVRRDPAGVGNTNSGLGGEVRSEGGKWRQVRATNLRLPPKVATRSESAEGGNAHFRGSFDR